MRNRTPPMFCCRACFRRRLRIPTECHISTPQSVYTMQTLWIGFTDSVVSAWKSAEQSITQGFNMDLGEKVSVTGSFSASAISAMGVGSTMDRVAKATEKSEKHLEKIANKDAKAEGKPDEKKKEQAKEPDKDDPALNEMKVQTRILRDISTKGVFV